eukprot:scaffold6124_cov122-Cylindrotheca_fusiformis.AAC.31
MSPNVSLIEPATPTAAEDERIRCAILGTGMMGQEHISYIMGYSKEVRIDFLCDPFQKSLEVAEKILQNNPYHQPTFLSNEDELLGHVDKIDLLVIATPNFMHTPTLLRWGWHDITILCEKPVAVSHEQHQELQTASRMSDWKARIWVAMEYRYIPAIARLLSLIPEIGDIKMVTIRENRYPFLHKVGKWNRDRNKTGDTLVEKCCHFFDLFRLITGKEVNVAKVKALAQRGINYHDEEDQFEKPIIDSAFVTMPFQNDSTDGSPVCSNAIGCLELCMFAEGSRHQEEIIVTGTKGRLEAYLPENKVFMYKRPTLTDWQDRSIPPPKECIQEHVFDCSNVKDVRRFRKGAEFCPQVSLNDGLRAVEIGLHATSALDDDTSG